MPVQADAQDVLALPRSANDHALVDHGAGVRARLGTGQAEGWHLAAVTPHTGWTAGRADPTDLARRLGGWADWHHQHTRHTHQRAAWRAWLERRRSPTINPGQLLIDEITAALHADETAWIAEYANGTSPPPASPHHTATG